MTSAGGDPANHRVSVVIATRERPEAVVQAVRSALAVDAATIEVVVVDQSQVPLTRGALIERLGTPPPGRSLTVEGSTRRGVSAGRNRGISLATGELILITDDDCTLATNTVSALRTAFGADKRIGIVYGNVRAIDHDRALGFVPSYHRSEPFLAQGLEDKHLVEGLSACMGLRKRIWEELGGFDEQLGVGSAFGSGAENDLAIRALVAGHLVYESPDVQVTHHGYREFNEGEVLISRYWFGTGAMYAKHLKLGTPGMMRHLTRVALRWTISRSPISLSLGPRALRWRRLASFARGLRAGLACRVDPKRGHFVS